MFAHTVSASAVTAALSPLSCAMFARTSMLLYSRRSRSRFARVTNACVSLSVISESAPHTTVSSSARAHSTSSGALGKFHEGVIIRKASLFNGAATDERYQSYDQLNKDFLGAAGCLVQIDGRVKLKQPEHIRFCGEDGLPAENERFNRSKPRISDDVRHFAHFEVLQEPLIVDTGVLSTGHETVAAHVVETVGVELAGDDGRINRIVPSPTTMSATLSAKPTPNSS